MGYRYFLNLGISEELRKLFPNIIPIPRPIMPTFEINKDWLIGFIDGEGCFQWGGPHLKSVAGVPTGLKGGRLKTNPPQSISL